MIMSGAMLIKTKSKSKSCRNRISKVLFIACLVSVVSVGESMAAGGHHYHSLQRMKRQFFANNPDFLNPDYVDIQDRQDQQQQQQPQPRGRQRQRQRLPPGAELIFSNTRPIRPIATPTVAPQFVQPNNNNNNNIDGSFVFINNRPTLATVAPFTGRTTPSPQFLRCFNSCPTTPEYNPICGSNQELYFNEQKFNCARKCGSDIQIVRRGSCEGLFPMNRG